MDSGVWQGADWRRKVAADPATVKEARDRAAQGPFAVLPPGATPTPTLPLQRRRRDAPPRARSSPGQGGGREGVDRGPAARRAPRPSAGMRNADYRIFIEVPDSRFRENPSRSIPSQASPTGAVAAVAGRRRVGRREHAANVALPQVLHRGGGPAVVSTGPRNTAAKASQILEAIPDGEDHGPGEEDLGKAYAEHGPGPGRGWISRTEAGPERAPHGAVDQSLRHG